MSKPEKIGTLNSGRGREEADRWLASYNGSDVRNRMNRDMNSPTSTDRIAM